MRVLLIAPHYDKNTPGESWSTYKWVQGISEVHDTTVLTTHKRHWSTESSPVRSAEIVNWPDLNLPKTLRRLEWELKPTYLLFYWRARKWLKSAIGAGRRFDIIHQINPLALRYPCPSYDLRIPFVMGPLAGSITTPAGFQRECKDRQWYRKLRVLDRTRIKYDPWLRQSYCNASVVLGVAPYIEELFAGINIKKFVVESETGVESVGDLIVKPPKQGELLRLLFVGRIIRTKGVIDAIRAISLVKNARQKVRFDVIGDGDMRAECEQVVRQLGLAETIHFHGRIRRDEVENWYKSSHVFLFPSFREPSGNVVFEAMGHGLPIIGSARGGPGYVIDSNCGFRVEPRTPEQYSEEIAICIENIINQPSLVEYFSKNCLKRMREIALWTSKVSKITQLYHQL